MIIDIHAHYTPQAMLDAFHQRAGEFPSVELLHEDGRYALNFCGGTQGRPIMPKLRDAEQRAAWLGEKGIDHQVCGGWLDSFGYEIPAEEGAAWSRFINEHLLAATSGRGELTALASVPLQDGRLAAEVLKEAVDAGFPGAMIGTQPKGASGNLDDPDLDPFWQMASDLGTALYIHPMFGCGDPRLDDYHLINTVGRGTDTTTAVARMLFAGHFQKYPGMKVILSHGGGALPYMLGRLDRNYQTHKDDFADPVAGLKGLYFDSVLFDPEALGFLCRVVGAGRVMLGSDYPFPIGDPEPTKVVHDCDLAAGARADILGNTAAALFGIG